jgi:hypothetical protein
MPQRRKAFIWFGVRHALQASPLGHVIGEHDVVAALAKLRHDVAVPQRHRLILREYAIVPVFFYFTQVIKRGARPGAKAGALKTEKTFKETKTHSRSLAG